MSPLGTRTSRSVPFRINRQQMTTNGALNQVDGTVAGHLAELNAILAKRNFEIHEPAPGAGTTTGTTRTSAKTTGTFTGNPITAAVNERLKLKLTPKRTPAGAPWANSSLLERFNDNDENEGDRSLAELIDLTPELSQLKYEFSESMDEQWPGLEFNARAVLSADYPAITDYLLAKAYFGGGLQTVAGLKNFVLKNSNGATAIADYASVSAARSIVYAEQLNVADVNNDNGQIAKDVRAAKLSLSAISFAEDLKVVVDDHIFNAGELGLIAIAEKLIGDIPDGIKPQLVKYMRSSPVKIVESNVTYWVPLFVSQIMGGVDVEEQDEVDVEESDKDFDVHFFTDERSQIQVSQSAVKCAAQLYYTMVLGDELKMFDVVNFFTHKYLLREGFEIEDARLRSDLKQYVLSNVFTTVDPRTNSKQRNDRTRPAERHMFYRQVFNCGGGEVTEDIIVNDEFNRLWKVLILESAKYLQRAQISPNPDSFVSPQPVMQAVEDLQYNLSVHTTGMATVAGPLIYEELDFVTRRILMHPEVLRNVVPQGGTWWKVVERLHVMMKGSRPRATVLNNKARYGHDILRAIADYEPAAFAQNFQDFIGLVDGFIITQSILQESLTDQLKGDPEAESQPGTHDYAPPIPAMAGAPTNGSSNGSSNGTNDDEWDF